MTFPAVFKPRLIVIAGPTGVGKTEVALRLAVEFGGEIISADAMQVYRLMDIGTAKPTQAQRSLVKHHLLDVADPDEPFHASLFIRQTTPIIDQLHCDHRPVFVVGGTGLYIRSLLGGLFAGPEADESLRQYYRDQWRTHGKMHLHEMLKKADEQAARRINPNDAVRIIRALEVMHLSGQSITELQERHRFGEQRYHCLKLGLKMDRDQLNRRIAERAERMMTAGLVDEVCRLLDLGYSASLKSMQSLGYRHVIGHLMGGQDLSDALRSMIGDTRRYAKRQMTWFGADREMIWFLPEDIDGIRRKVAFFLHEAGGAGQGIHLT